MNQLSKISNLFIYFLVTYLFVSILNEQNSGFSSFYYFEKPQDANVEKVVDHSISDKFNFKFHFAKYLSKELLTFDISSALSAKQITLLSYSSNINIELFTQIIPHNHIPTYQKIISDDSDDASPIFC